MSMPPPPQQPTGPYGPHQPYPQGVAHQPYPPQGFAHQPHQPYPPHGVPHQAYPHPYPGPPVPPRKRTGLVIGIVAGSVAVLALLAWAGRQGLDAVGGGSFPAAEYRLTAPVTLLDGAYKLTSDTSEKDGKDVEAEDRADPSVRVTKSVIATYSGEPGTVLVISGFYGQLRSPDLTRKQILEGGATAEGTTLAVPPKDFTPAGSGVTVSCQVTRSTDMGATSTVPMCAWGDGNTASFVALVTPEIARQDPEKVDLRALAETTAAVRADIREPLT
ncbi:hypothetical protein [Streptomyces sp. NRRL S-118]|uniref:hypothetical protein n=1 Tax=Streptomyces sp. NRRL S-118 TaxID=1463881 RepID=UPI0004C95716|nr:hypothetical protein [Streptomyces sp. NRRL S-118]